MRIPLYNRGGVTVTLSHGYADGQEITEVLIGGERLDALADLAQAKMDKYVRWARHLLWRGVVGFIGLLFVQTLNPGPLYVAVYAVWLVIAGELSLKLDRREALPWPF